MGLSKKGGVILAISLFVAVFAIVWPVDYIPHGIKIAIEKAVCPLVRRTETSMYNSPIPDRFGAMQYGHMGALLGSQAQEACES